MDRDRYPPENSRERDRPGERPGGRPGGQVEDWNNVCGQSETGSATGSSGLFLGRLILRRHPCDRQSAAKVKIAPSFVV